MATPRKTRLKIGVIGLGIIGSRVAANLRAAGHQVYVWSRSPHSAPNFLGSVVEVADLCDIIQIFVSDDAALLDVARTMGAALGPRHVVAVHATVSPQAARQTASIIESQGARYLDAPFTGSKVAAQNGQLVYYVAGSEPALSEVRLALEASSKKIIHVSGKIGDASVLKIATNMLTATTVQTLAEALALVTAAGIDGAKLAEAFENNASRSGTSDLKLPAMLSRNFEANFSLKHMLKDVRLALALAEQSHVAVPATSAAGNMLSHSLEKGWGDEDFSAVVKNYDPPAPRSEPAPPEEPPAGHLPVESDAPATPPPQAPETVPPPKAETPTTPEAKDTPPSPAAPPASGPVQAPTPSLPAIDPIPVPAAADPNRSKKSTLRLIRDFFKPEVARSK